MPSREERQDINKRRAPAGSDLSARGKGITYDNAKGERTGELPPQRPEKYKGRHERGRG